MSRTRFILVACALALPVASHAETRGSANYSVTTDALGAAGGASSAGTIESVASVGGMGIIAHAAPTQSRSGFPAQLVDPTALTVTASPGSVPEGDATQLTGAFTMDDDTVSPLAGSDIDWTPVGGPIVAVSSGGVATTDGVYEDSAASVQGDRSGFSDTASITVLNLDIDNFGAYAADGIDDAWQVLYFGIGNPNAGPGIDFDGDGQSNFFEYVAGLIPTDSNSNFSLSIANVPGLPAHKDIIFEPRFTNRTYEVLATPDLNNPAGLVPLAGSPPLTDLGQQRTVTDTNANQSGKAYGINIYFP